MYTIMNMYVNKLAPQRNIILECAPCTVLFKSRGKPGKQKPLALTTIDSASASP